jgi:hypothetical protein
MQLFRAALEKKSVGFSHLPTRPIRCLIQVALFAVHWYSDLLHTHFSGLGDDAHLGHVGVQFLVGTVEEENVAASAIGPEACAARAFVH